MSERRERTLNDKFDSRCVSCGFAAYCLWVASEPPPPGCPEGHDGEIHLCPLVYTNFTAITLKLDGLIRGEISPQGRALKERLGLKAEELIAHIRSGKSPDEWRRKHGRKKNNLPRELSETKLQ